MNDINFSLQVIVSAINNIIIISSRITSLIQLKAPHPKKFESSKKIFLTRVIHLILFSCFSRKFIYRNFVQILKS